MAEIQLKREHYILSGLLLAIVVVLCFFFIFQPGFAKLKHFKLEAKKKLEEVKEAENVIAQRGALEKELKRIQEEIANYEKRLPVGKEIPKLLEELSARADDARIKFFSFQPAESSPLVVSSALYTEIPIRMSLKSGYHELGKFINYLENSGRFMRVTDLSITADSSQPRLHEVHLTISTYISQR